MMIYQISAALFLVSAVIFIFRRLRYRRSRLPPGSLGMFLIGETLQLIGAYRTENPEPFIDDRVRRFGPVFTTHVFGEPTVFSADPETNRFVLQNEGRLFEVSYPASICNLLGKHSLLLTKGALHKRMHALTTSFANSSIIKDHLMVDIDRLVRTNLDSWSNRIVLMEEAKKITFELAVKQLMSYEPGEWSESLRKEYVSVMEGFFSLPSQFFSPTYRRAIKARTKVAEALSVAVRRRREYQEATATGEIKKDMLGALLATEEGFSDEEIVDFMVAFLVAGYETTSTTMTLAVKFLTETPLALAQLKVIKTPLQPDKNTSYLLHNRTPLIIVEHEEIEAKKTHGETLEWSDYKSMHFTQCVVNETLRVANIISGVFRRTTTDVNIKGYVIPKGWKVFSSFRAVHLDHDHFKDARSFNPWRWESGSAATGSSNVFTPFGGGPRLCPGYELARVQLSVFLHHFVTRFSWVVAEDDKLVFFPTTRMQKGYPVIVQRRNLPSTT